MSLPKIDVPLHTVKLEGIKKNVKYRSYTVKEEKLLLMAAESKDQKEISDTVIRLCQGCVITKIDIESLPMTDLEKLMITIRSKSVGEAAKVGLVCPHCEKKTDMSVDLENMIQVGDDTIEDKIMLNKQYGLKLKPPSLISVEENASDELNLINNSIISVIDSLFDKDNVYLFSDYSQDEKVEFVDSMSIEDAKKITEGYLEKLPRNVIKLDYECPHCNNKVSRELDNLIDFFT